MNRSQQKARHSLAPWISFLVSFSIHLAIGIAMAAFLIGGGRGFTKLEIAGAMNEDAAANESLDILQIEHSDEPTDESELPTINLALETIVAEVVQPSSSSSDDSASYARLASQIDALGDDPGGGSDGQMSKATFFGAEAYGNRFVFVIDSSRSMIGPRWEALCYELEQAIRSLSLEQEYFIISFDSEAHPMFGAAPPKGKFLAPDPKSIRRVRNWLRSIELGRNTFPSSSMMMALSLKPDAIFLLSDGEIRDSTLTDLRQVNSPDANVSRYSKAIPVHTVLLHSEIGYQTLEQIAADNHGTFTPVPFSNSR
jgi:von Willebrand factor type A domain